jgi:hypothetical protein
MLHRRRGMTGKLLPVQWKSRYSLIFIEHLPYLPTQRTYTSVLLNRIASPGQVSSLRHHPAERHSKRCYRHCQSLRRQVIHPSGNRIVCTQPTPLLNVQACTFTASTCTV